jgi:hypothetical protein
MRICGRAQRPAPDNSTTITSIVGESPLWAPVSTARTLNPEEHYIIAIELEQVMRNYMGDTRF